MYLKPQSTTQKYVFQTEVIPSIFIPSTAAKAHRPANRQPWRLSSCLSVVAVFMTHGQNLCSNSVLLKAVFSKP